MSNLLELARKLHQERVFIRSEQEAIHQLNKQIRLRMEQLSHMFWTTRQHHINLNHFITNSSQGVPSSCSQRARRLDNVKFVDGYKKLGYQESMYANFLHAFRSNPTLAAACLAYGEKLGLVSTAQVVQSVVIGLYGNDIVSGEHGHLLELMETLLLLQLANEDQPRRVMHKGNAAFCIVYRLFTESLPAGRLFLTSALHKPIMQVLMEDELYLERDSKKILDCFSPADIEKKFGKHNDPEFHERVKKHLEWTEHKFYEICQSFIDSLHAEMFRFPQPIGWVIARVYHIIKESGLISQEEARVLCSDLMLQMFVSPAIVTPELYGMTGDAPISEFTRFNLMQIAKTLQVLALRDEEGQHDNDFYSRFQKNSMSSLLDAVIDTWHTDGVPASTNSEYGLKGCSVFITSQQLVQLIQLLRDIQNSDVRGVDQSSLAEILNHLPDVPPRALDPQAARRESVDTLLESETTVEAGGSLKADLIGDDSRPEATNDVVLVISLAGVSSATGDPPGMLSENEVLEMQVADGSSGELNSEPELASTDVNVLNDADSERIDKRIRFSHYSTDFSELGEGGMEDMSATSGSSIDDIDPVESVPADDASSFHGTSSHGNQDEDLEMEEGDLESVPHANNDEVLKALERKLPTSRESIEDKMRKFEIRPQFGVRFGGAVVAGVDSEEGDQTETGHGTAPYLDTRSETWSTDVYASDSETATEQGDPPEQRLQEISENPEPGQMRSSSAGPYLSLLPRDEDARSDVWSVEVLPSDSEPPDVKPEDRLQELESESNPGQEDPIDPMEDNRSRTSTPGLSAASGVSGTSGVSMVSDNLHAKGGDEHGSSSEKSFGKTPSSISPDAEDLVVGQRGSSTGPRSSRLSAAGSSHSSGSGEIAASNAGPHSSATVNLIDSQTQLAGIAGQEDGFFKKLGGKSSLVKRSKSASLANAGHSKPLSPVLMPSGASHLNWPEKTKQDRHGAMNGHNSRILGDVVSPSVRTNAVSMPEEVIDPIHEVLVESDNINTIKRSPYKQSDTFMTGKDSAFNSVQSSLASNTPTDTVTHAKHAASSSASNNFHAKTNGISPGSLQEMNQSTFVPISLSEVNSYSPSSPHDISAFDPLSSPSSSHVESSQILPNPVTTEHNVLNVNSIAVALVDISTAGGESAQGVHKESQTSSPLPNPGGRSKYGHSMKHTPTSHDGKGIERKKSWWKSPKLPVLSGRRKTMRPISTLQSSKEETVTASSDIANGYKTVDGANADLPKPLEPSLLSSPPDMDNLGEDIMEKYMRKAASSQSPRMSHSRSVPVPSASAQSAQRQPSTSKVDPFLDDIVSADKTLDSQNPNSSSNTPSNVSSTASERTVTTVTQGTSPGMSPPASDKSSRALQSTCQATRIEYMPDSAQLIADAQRKLRLMLSTSELFPESSHHSDFLSRMSAQPYSVQKSHQSFNEDCSSRNSMKNKIISFLKLQLAEAVSLQDHSRIAQIHETTRCVEMLDSRDCKEVLQTLWREYKQRSAYVAYLVRTKQALLTVSSYLQHMLKCTERDQQTCRWYLTTVFVTLFLKRMDNPLKSFRMQFTQCTAADEKVALVHRFLSYLYGQMSRDGIWENASEDQLQEAQRAIERSVYVYIYKLAIYPNGDGDVMRDQLFYEHIARLGKVVTSQHPALLIPKKYLNECPWTSAQAEARSLNAFKTPRDKLAAVLRCCNTIMNLLKMADEGTVPGADDFTPVLVYVLIMANPPHLLSTIQYITSFLGDGLTGEDSYWWMQFTAATEFIKTIDERK